MRLAGKVAIISGAASGMGAATARMFAREGAKVVIADVLEHEGRQVADGIGVSARFEQLDVTQEGSWAAVVAATTGLLRADEMRSRIASPANVPEISSVASSRIFPLPH